MVIVTVDASRAVTAQVVDLTNGSQTDSSRRLSEYSRTYSHGQRFRESAPVDGPRTIALSIQLLAGGWRAAELFVSRELRTRAHDGAGRDTEVDENAARDGRRPTHHDLRASSRRCALRQPRTATPAKIDPKIARVLGSGVCGTVWISGSGESGTG